MREALLHLKHLRAARRRSRLVPAAIPLRSKNADILAALYPGFTFNEIKALFPLKVTGTGGGKRYVVVPKLVDRWLQTLPDA